MDKFEIKKEKIISIPKGHMRFRSGFDDDGKGMIIIRQSDIFQEYGRAPKDEPAEDVIGISFDTPRQALILATMLTDLACEMQWRLDNKKEETNND